MKLSSAAAPGLDRPPHVGFLLLLLSCLLPHRVSAVGIDAVNEVPGGVDGGGAMEAAVAGTYIVSFNAEVTVEAVQALVSQLGVPGGPYAHVAIKDCPTGRVEDVTCRGYISIGKHYKLVNIRLPTRVKDGKTEVMHTGEVEALRKLTALVKVIEADGVVHIAEDDDDIPRSSAQRIRVRL